MGKGSFLEMKWRWVHSGFDGIKYGGRASGEHSQAEPGNEEVLTNGGLLAAR
jgi:hypothetical protein